MYYSVFSGHESSVAVVADGGQVRSVAEGDCLNLHCHTPDVVVPNLRRVMDDVLRSAGLPPVGVDFSHSGPLVIALPGISTARDLQSATACVHETFRSGFPHFYVADDTWAGLVAGRQSAVGICAFAGIGASVYVGPANYFTPGKPYKLDGYGPMIGDHGSEFRLAIRVLEEIGRLLDNRQHDNPILGRLLEMEPDLLPSIQNWFARIQQEASRAWPTRISRLARVVIEAADATPPDTLATSLVTEAADAITETIAAGIELARVDWPPDTPAEAEIVTCHGDMFRHSRHYFQQVANGIEKVYPPATIKLARYHPVVGGLIMAHSDSWTVPAPDVTAKILDSISQLSPAHRALLDYEYAPPASSSSPPAGS